MRQMRVLVVEDNGELVVLLTKALERAGLDVDGVRTVGDAEASLRAMNYAAVVLDLGLPDADGLSLLDQMRRRRDTTPVLILTARSGIEDRVKGLDKGASDYLIKPFATEELIARLQALLRRSPTPEGHVLTLGNIALETAGRQTSVAGKPVAVPAREARSSGSADEAQRPAGLARGAARPGLRCRSGRVIQRHRGLHPSPAPAADRRRSQCPDPHDPRRWLPDEGRHRRRGVALGSTAAGPILVIRSPGRGRPLA
jgi:CheY-like chemotaxis protein